MMFTNKDALEILADAWEAFTEWEAYEADMAEANPWEELEP